MSESVITVRDFFDLPQPGSPEESSPRWQTLRQWMSEELQGANSSAMDNVGAKIGELFEVPISDIFVASWKSTDAIKQLLEESRKAPDAVTSLELADHTIKSQHHPHIEVKTRSASTKKIAFSVRLLFKLKGFSLRVQDGAIREMHSGPCEVEGTLEYQGLAVAEKKLAPIKLPATVALEGSEKVEVKESKPLKTPPSEEVEKAPEKTPEKAPPLEPPKPQLKPPMWSAPVKQQPISPAPDAPKLTPPVKVTAKITEAAREQTITEVPAEPAMVEEEEEREVFVL